MNFSKRTDCRRCRAAVKESWRAVREAGREGGGPVYADRWEQEQQQHQDYLDKRQRVNERRQASYKKKAEVSLEYISSV